MTTAHFRKKWAVDFLLFIKSKLIQFHGRGGNLRIGRARDRRKNGVTFTVTPFFATQ